MSTQSQLRSVVVLCTVLVTSACGGVTTPTRTATSSGAPVPATATDVVPAPTAPISTPMGLVMSDGRAMGTATLLSDGRVLVAGGFQGDIANTSADVFDPAARSFRPTGGLAFGRFWQTATLLKDGRVVLIGGTGASRAMVPLAEAWDPGTGNFTAAGNIPGSPTLHTATLLLDGRVLVVGGVTPAETPIAEAWIWDPATMGVTPAGKLLHARGWHSAVRLDDGRVLVAGGPAEAEIWDPATQTFAPAGMLATPRWWTTATLLSDGRVVLIGGFKGDRFIADADVLATMEIWDPATSSFMPGGSLTIGRAIHAAVLLPDDRIVVIGGATDAGATGQIPTASVEIWDRSIKVAGPDTITFTASQALNVARQGATATLLGDGTILVAGGNGEADRIGSAELLGPFGP